MIAILPDASSQRTRTTELCQKSHEINLAACNNVARGYMFYRRFIFFYATALNVTKPPIAAA